MGDTESRLRDWFILIERQLPELTRGSGVDGMFVCGQCTLWLLMKSVVFSFCWKFVLFNKLFTT